MLNVLVESVLVLSPVMVRVQSPSSVGSTRIGFG